jgi:hypothetical protein
MKIARIKSLRYAWYMRLRASLDFTDGTFDRRTCFPMSRDLMKLFSAKGMNLKTRKSWLEFIGKTPRHSRLS